MVSKNLLKIAERLGRKDVKIEAVRKPEQGGIRAFPEIVMDSPKDYIQIPESSHVIAKRQDYNKLQWEPALKKVQEQGLTLPRIDIFMQHNLNLQAASEGKK